MAIFILREDVREAHLAGDGWHLITAAKDGELLALARAIEAGVEDALEREAAEMFQEAVYAEYIPRSEVIRLQGADQQRWEDSADDRAIDAAYDASR
jgi:hypothetical protein